MRPASHLRKQQVDTALENRSSHAMLAMSPTMQCNNLTSLRMLLLTIKPYADM
jgi:hypothetical protein